MKIEIELDSELVMHKVVEALVSRLHLDMKEHVKNMLGLVFMEEIRKEARKEIEQIFKDLKLPDGRTFRQYIEDVILKPRTAYPNRPRLQELIDQRVWQEAERMFGEIVKDHIDVFKDKLSKAVMDKVMHA